MMMIIIIMMMTPPLFLDQTEAQRAEKIFFLTPVTPCGMIGRLGDQNFF